MKISDSKVKIPILLIGILLILSACSGYRNLNVSEDGNTRMLLTDEGSEIEVPNHPERVVLIRAVDIGNSMLLDANVVGVSDIAKDSYIEEEVEARGITMIEHGDLEAIEALDPDLIVTYKHDIHYLDYRDIATTIEINSAPPLFMTPYRARQYLDHMYYISIILNQEETGREFSEGLLNDHLVMRRELNFDATDYSAIVISSVDEKYYVHAEYNGYGTEAVYDIFDFEISSSVRSLVNSPQEFEDDLTPYRELEFDYAFVFLEEDDYDTAQIAEDLNIDEEFLIVEAVEPFRLNDLMSVRMQVDTLLEALNNK